MKNIVFFGGGNMAAGIIKGLTGNDVARADDILVSEPLEARREFLEKELGVKAVADAADSLSGATIAVIAVNPGVVKAVTSAIKDKLDADTIVLSIASGVDLAALTEQLGADRKILRVMPNTLIEARNGHSAACVNPNITDADKEIITEFLNALGQTMYIDESMFQTFTAFSCTGPIWMYKTVEALIDAGVYAGFSRADARKIVLKNMLGIAQVLESTGAHPALRVDDMTSPAGVTIEALQVFQQEGIAGGLMTSVDAAVKKANRQ